MLSLRILIIKSIIPSVIFTAPCIDVVIMFVFHQRELTEGFALWSLFFSNEGSKCVCVGLFDEVKLICFRGCRHVCVMPARLRSSNRLFICRLFELFGSIFIGELCCLSGDQWCCEVCQTGCLADVLSAVFVVEDTVDSLIFGGIGH